MSFSQARLSSQLPQTFQPATPTPAAQEICLDVKHSIALGKQLSSKCFQGKMILIISRSGSTLCPGSSFCCPTTATCGESTCLIASCQKYSPTLPILVK